MKPIQRFKDKFFKYLYLIQDFLVVLSHLLKSVSSVVFVFAALFYFGIVVFHFGFHWNDILTIDFFKIYQFIFYTIYLSKYIQVALQWKKRKLIGWLYEGFLFFVSTLVLIISFIHRSGTDLVYYQGNEQVILIVVTVLLIFSEAYKLMEVISRIKIDPSLLFAFSFLFIILAGTGLLLLPTTHIIPLSLQDALFTSTSAVCVTGLIVVDTATAFTPLGQWIILLLIQIGGLGIMSFTGFFGFIFTGTVSFKDRLLLKDILSSESLGGVFRFITKIILSTFLVEALGAIIIYFNVVGKVANPLFFSLFHAVSAFCNAGFSTLSSGLSSPELQGNNVIGLTIAGLIILGGIGFPVMIMFYAFLKDKAFNLVKIRNKKTSQVGSLKRNIGVRLALYTTLVLLIIGTVFYYLFEKNNSLMGLDGTQKWVVAFFGSVSARTAGFNIIDITQWSYTTIFLMIFLMWVGASPGSTGGGIKTTTFALAMHVVYNFLRGRTTIHIGYRQIGHDTVGRVLVTIIVSIIVIAFGYFGLLIVEADKNPVHLLFECVSAYATVGLSIVNTPTLSEVGKWIIIVMMFVGRVGPVALLTGIFTMHKKRFYKYPVQELVIN